MKLASFYTIQRELYGSKPKEATVNAEQPEEYVDFFSGSEFSQLINGMLSTKAWAIMDELMATLKTTNQELYTNIIKKLGDG